MQWFVYALLSALFAALATIFAKIGLKNIDPTIATAIRSIVMVLIVIIFLILVKGYNTWFEIIKLSKDNYIYLILSGLMGALSWILYFYALKFGEASKVSFVDRSSVLFVLLLAIVFLGEKLSLTKALASILIFLGLILLSI